LTESKTASRRLQKTKRWHPYSWPIKITKDAFLAHQVFCFEIFKSSKIQAFNKCLKKTVQSFPLKVKIVNLSKLGLARRIIGIRIDFVHWKAKRCQPYSAQHCSLLNNQENVEMDFTFFALKLSFQNLASSPESFDAFFIPPPCQFFHSSKQLAKFMSGFSSK
jgi:hypothetical protein